MKRNPMKLLKALRIAFPHLVQYLDEVGPCDHSTGICVCSLRSDMEFIQEILNEYSETGK